MVVVVWVRVGGVVVGLSECSLVVVLAERLGYFQEHVCGQGKQFSPREERYSVWARCGIIGFLDALLYVLVLDAPFVSGRR